MRNLQEEGFPTVVKVSEKNYAVRAKLSASNPIGYVHVVADRNPMQVKLFCTANECKKKQGRTKQVQFFLFVGYRKYSFPRL